MVLVILATLLLCHAFDAQVRWTALVDQILRRRFAQETAAKRARLWADVQERV